MSDMITNPENATESAGRGDATTASVLESYRRPWSVSIDDENCRAVIRDADGLEVAYISDVIRSRAGETAQMFVDLVAERDSLAKLWGGMMSVVHRNKRKADEYKRLWEKATGSEFAKKLATARAERDILREALKNLMTFTCNSCERRFCEEDVEEEDGQRICSPCNAILNARAAVGEDRP